MATLCFRRVLQRYALGWALLAPLTALAADDSTQLALVLRQLDAIERTAQRSSVQTHTSALRYHFDYQRLHQDIQRVRVGIQHFLSPQRAQPRDSVALIGDYRDPQEPAP
ncbi:hypothetical protein PS664_02237 [Pseudomonas fluorescens]|nr:hypothetical protein PS664_02237 [Pseudomonas fluorescens]